MEGNDDLDRRLRQYYRDEIAGIPPKHMPPELREASPADSATGAAAAGDPGKAATKSIRPVRPGLGPAAGRLSDMLVAAAALLILVSMSLVRETPPPDWAVHGQELMVEQGNIFGKLDQFAGHSAEAWRLLLKNRTTTNEENMQ